MPPFPLIAGMAANTNRSNLFLVLDAMMNKMIIGMAMLYLAILGVAGFKQAHIREDILGMLFSASSILVIFLLVRVWKYIASSK